VRQELCEAGAVLGSGHSTRHVSASKSGTDWLFEGARWAPAGCNGGSPPWGVVTCQRSPALLEQVGQAFQPWARSTFSAMAICCDREARLAVGA
jgi:hypothetical protein